MDVGAEHALLRTFLQALGSTYAYAGETLPEGRWQHQPPRPLPRERRNAPLAVGPDALAFASAPPLLPQVALPGPAPGPPPRAAGLDHISSTPRSTGLPGVSLAEHLRAFAGTSSPPTSEAETLRDRLAVGGFRLLARDGRLFVRHDGGLSVGDEERSQIKAMKPALLALAEPWPEEQPASLAVFLGTAPPIQVRSDPNWHAQPPPDISNIHDIVLNFETDGLDWRRGNKPVGVTIGSLDGRLHQYLPFAHRGGGNLDEEQVLDYLRREVRGKRITNANTRFDVHMGMNIGVDFEAQGCEVSDVQHWAALLDDHRRRFALDVLARDYLGGVEVERVDERVMADYHAAEVAPRAEYQAQLVSQLHAKMWSLLDEQDLQHVRQLEDDVIYPLCEMERNGSPLDVELLRDYHARCTARHDELMMEVSREAGFAFEHTASGWKQLLEHLRLDVPDSFKESVLDQYDHPLVKTAQEASRYASLDSKTFFAYMQNIDASGVLYYDIHQLRSDEGGTVSGRFSIPYVHQIPNQGNHFAAFGEDLYPRRLFIGAGGLPYLSADAMQIEFRLFAHHAKNAAILQAYRDDPTMSFHRKMEALLQQYKPDIVYEHVKNFNFARQYGARLVKLATMMGFITEGEAAEIRARKAWHDPRLATIREIEAAYARVLPEGDALLDRAAHLAKPNCDDYCWRGDALHRQYRHRGYVKTLVGRRSRFHDGYKTYIALNRVLQGSGADIMKRKVTELHRERRYTGLRMRLTTHDQVGGDATLPETRERVAEVLNAQSYPELRVPILWDCETGPSMADCK